MPQVYRRFQSQNPALTDCHLSPGPDDGGWPSVAKRVFDLLCAGALLLLTSPLFAVIFIALLLGGGGPVFFVQKRVGKHGVLFNCYKFRSMYTDADERLRRLLAANPDIEKEFTVFQKLAPQHENRVTRIGSLLRKTNMDELPQLFNVVKGTMSLVGPRPCMPEQRHYYGMHFFYYIKVKPGITGLWQVSGRNRLTFLERVDVECQYVLHQSFWLDMKILLKTIPVLLRRNPVAGNRA